MAGFQFVLIVLLLFVFISTAGCLTCYACSLSNEHDKTCVEDNRMLIDSKEHMKGFVKNCTKNESYCMIEKITTKCPVMEDVRDKWSGKFGLLLENEDSFASYIRDCSNGHSFSYSKIDRLRGITPNNSSRCAFYNEHTICITLCLGDFCNGPQEVSCAHFTFFSKHLLYFTFVFLYSVRNIP